MPDERLDELLDDEIAMHEQAAVRLRKIKDESSSSSWSSSSMSSSQSSSSQSSASTASSESSQSSQSSESSGSSFSSESSLSSASTLSSESSLSSASSVSSQSSDSSLSSESSQSSQSSQSGGGGVSLSSLVKVGQFALVDNPAYTSGDDKLGFSGGIIGFDEAGVLWCIARSGRKFAPFNVPATFGGNSVQAGPWVDFTQGVTFPNADSGIAGLARHNGVWVMTVRPYYNGDSTLPWILVNGVMHTGSVVQRRAAGYLTTYGGKLYSGLAGIPIAQECSKGPVAYEWDIDPASIPDPVPCIEKLYYATPIAEWYQGVSDLDQIRGLCCGANYRLFLGRRPLGECWYGDGSNHPTLPGVTDPCSPYQGFHSEGSTTAAWLYDANWNYLEFARLDTLLGLPGPCSRILYAAQHGSRIYAVTPSAEMEPRPIVHVLEMA